MKDPSYITKENEAYSINIFIKKDIKQAKPPLLGVSFLWKACGFSKSLSNNNPLNILWDSFWIMKNEKKLRNENIDNRLNSKESLCI